ncbi:aquaporin [Terrimonas alba]|uniref:aquaporin n=1 Tax=Terrimonas alba TaxID=3349636 RepID=UPI0035F301F8
MRAMPIQVLTGTTGMKQLKAAFRKNRKHYLQEALGLAIFMVLACFFNAMIFSEKSKWHNAIPGEMAKNVLMGLIMGCTALFIFYSPWTAPSGSQINPAVTLTFLRLDKMCRYDAMFFVIFQFIGGLAAVFIMQALMGTILTDPPVNSSVTIPGKWGPGYALLTEYIIAFITMSMVLFTSHHEKLKRYTRIVSAILVCCWVIIAGPISGFGMNPARSFATALPSGIWTSFWIYLFIPFAGMLAAAEVFLFIRRRKNPTKPSAAEERLNKSHYEMSH